MYLRTSLTNLCEALRDFEKLTLGPCSCGHLLGVFFSSGGLLQSKLQSKVIRLLLKFPIIYSRNFSIHWLIYGIWEGILGRRTVSRPLIPGCSSSDETILMLSP